jgi:NADPH:quinone reductase
LKAIRQHCFGEPEVLVYEDLETPLPKENEVLIQVRAAAVNHFDILSRRGIIPHLPLPRIVGIDCTGYVMAYHGNRTDLTVGQPVVILGERMGNGGPGAYATHVCIHEEEVFPLPPALDMVAAACLGISYLTAWHALTERAQVQPGTLIFIPGVGGGVASAALQIALALGGRVMASSSSDQNCQRAVELGAEACFNYEHQNVAAEVRQLSGRGVDLVLNAVGAASLAQDLECLKHRGTLLTIGTAYGRQFNFDGFDFLLRELHLVGVNITPQTPSQRYQMLLKLSELMLVGKLHVLIDKTFDLSEAEAAHRLVETRQHFGKVVLLPKEIEVQ